MDGMQEMKQVSVCELLKEHCLVVPEIQREYVWGRNDFDILDAFLEDIKNGFSLSKKGIDGINPLQELLEKATELEKKLIQSLINESESKYQSNGVMNIGFLYSYKPNYYISDEGKDAYLIDGQQRFTTIFIILFYLAIKEKRLNEFKQLYRVTISESKIAFDYRVRSLTHNFIIDLIENVTNINDLISIRDKRWFLSNYKKDTTITAIVGDGKIQGALKIIHEKLKDEPLGYFDFVKNSVKFWHFKTEETSQGEELYITMNSRGQQLADNETIRAILFKTEEAKQNPIKWSSLWEEWQDFFWKKRADGATSADKGFNEFLACIGGLENYIHNRGKIYTKDDFDRYNQISTKDILTNVSLPIIESYINVLKFIEDKKIDFKKNYYYSSWVDKCISELWYLLNNGFTNWYADYEDANRATERNRMIFVWSFLYYASQSDLNELSEILFFRLLRLFYVRFKNFNRSVTTLKNTINLIQINGIFDTIENEIKGELDTIDNNGYLNINEETDEKTKTTEEIQKSNFFNRFVDNPAIQRQLEEIVWEIEDHKFNINGRDVGGVNIGYLVDFQKINFIEELQLIRNKLFEIFPEQQKEYKTIQNILLYYGEYWHRISPWYYYNNQFNNWERIIRDRDNENKPTRSVFKSFFYDFLKFEGTIEDFLIEKRNRRIEKENCHELFEKLCWYNQNLSDRMWSQGNYIAFSNSDDSNALPDYESQDKYFNNMKIIYNTKGNLKKGTPKALSDLIEE